VAQDGSEWRPAAVSGAAAGLAGSPPVLGRRPAIAAAPSRPSNRGMPPFVLFAKGKMGSEPIAM
jgi:hypothetical protein